MSSARHGSISITTPSAGSGARLDLSVIVVSWNARELLRACLHSIFEHRADLSLEVFVVDNASHDGSALMVRSEFTGVHLIANDENRGFAAANNQALPHARGRYVLLLNPDTLVLDDVLARSIEYADAHPTAGILGCKVLENATTVARSCFRFPSIASIVLYATGLAGRFGDSPMLGYESYAGWDRDTPRPVDVITGVFMLVRRETLDVIGLMDEDYFVYAEETDWCHRAWAAGWRCLYAPVGTIMHVDGGGHSTAQARVRMFVQMQKSLLLFVRKRRGWPRWAICKLLFIVAAIARAAWWRLVAARSADEAARIKTRAADAALRFHLTGREPA